MRSSKLPAADAGTPRFGMSGAKLVALFAVTMAAAALADAAVIEWLTARGHTLRDVGRLLSEGGTVRIMVPVALVVVLRAWILRRDAILRFLPRLVLATGLASATSSVLKLVFSRSRPNHPNPGELRLFAFDDDATSFPSGHATAAFAAAGAIGLAFPEYRRPMLVLAAVVGLGRILARRHYPLDVMGGAWLGVAFAWGMAWLIDRIVEARRTRATTGPS